MGGDPYSAGEEASFRGRPLFSPTQGASPRPLSWIALRAYAYGFTTYVPPPRQAPQVPCRERTSSVAATQARSMLCGAQHATHWRVGTLLQGAAGWQCRSMHEHLLQ